MILELEQVMLIPGLEQNVWVWLKKPPASKDECVCNNNTISAWGLFHIS